MPEPQFFQWSVATDRQLPTEAMESAIYNTRVMMADIERHVRNVPEASAQWEWYGNPEVILGCTPNGIDESTLKRMADIGSDGMKVAFSMRTNPAEMPQWPSEFGDEAKASALAIVGLLAPDDLLIFGNDADLQIAIVDPRPVRRLVSSVDGVITSLNGRFRANTMYAQVIEWRTNHTVKCFLDRGRWLDELRRRNVWEQHVIVYGRVLYNADGVPVTITDVTEIHERDSTVKLSDLEGRLQGMTGRYGVQGFVRRTRGGDG